MLDRLRKDSIFCQSEARCVPRNFSFSGFKLKRDLELSPFLRHTDKRQYSANGGEAHGDVSTEVHAGI
jgi:hypothetical protein